VLSLPLGEDVFRKEIYCKVCGIFESEKVRTLTTRHKKGVGFKDDVQHRDNFNSFKIKYILTVAIINYIDCDQSIKKQKLQVNNEILRKRRNPMQTPTCRKLSQSGFYPGPDWAK
jgi:hypothetical protein